MLVNLSLHVLCRFSGTLLGMAAATFLATDTWPRFLAVAAAVAVFGVITTIITQALGNTLVAGEPMA